MGGSRHEKALGGLGPSTNSVLQTNLNSLPAVVRRCLEMIESKPLAGKASMTAKVCKADEELQQEDWIVSQ